MDDCHTKILSILEKFKSNILLDLDVFLFGQIGKNVYVVEETKKVQVYWNDDCF